MQLILKTTSFLLLLWSCYLWILSQSFREVIPIMDFFREIKQIFLTHCPPPGIYYKTWEDNHGSFTLAQRQKFPPRTKNIVIKYHHFRPYIENESISIYPIDTKDQTTNILTKYLVESWYKCLRRKLNGWLYKKVLLQVIIGVDSRNNSIIVSSLKFRNRGWSSSVLPSITCTINWMARRWSL